MSLGITEVLLIAGVVLLIFGPSRLPGLGKSIGQAIRGFKSGIKQDEIDVTDSSREKERLHTQNSRKNEDGDA